MSSIIILVIVYIVATVVKTTMKRAAETFEANMPGQMPPPVSETEEPVALPHDMNDETNTDIGALLQALTAKVAVEESQAVVAEPKKRVKAETPAPRIAVPEGDAEEIRLRTAEEARRAFIYSEIFNRKYE